MLWALLFVQPHPKRTGSEGSLLQPEEFSLSGVSFGNKPMIWKALCLTAFSTLMLVAAGHPIQAASFDCAKAEAADEKAICTDRRLDDADVEMAVLYTQLKPLLAMSAQENLEGAQVAWLKRRTACGGDRACLSKAYADQLWQLRGAFEELAKRGPF